MANAYVIGTEVVITAFRFSDGSRLGYTDREFKVAT